MKKYILIFIIIVISSCSQKVDLASIDLINGYWQIKKVVNANGDKKEYKINEIYDYFEVKRNNGFHKKVKWQPSGAFLVNNAQDSVKITNIDNKIHLNFVTKFGKHKEELESISDKEMVLVSEIQTAFYYEKVILDKK
jgi:Lipocalin-like domain